MKLPLFLSVCAVAIAIFSIRATSPVRIKITQQGEKTSVTKDTKENIINYLEKAVSDAQDALFLVVTDEMTADSKRDGTYISIIYKKSIPLKIGFLGEDIQVRSIQVLMASEPCIVVITAQGKNYTLPLSQEQQEAIIEILESVGN